MDSDLMRAAAVEVASKIEAALADPAALTVRLTREEALLCQGLLEGLADLIDREAEYVHIPFLNGIPTK